jgi:type II restriction enzyme
MTRIDESNIIEGATQAMLRDLGEGWGFRVLAAALQQRDQPVRSEFFNMNDAGQPVIVGLKNDDRLHLIDTAWLEPETHRLAAVFTLEHRTAIYSGLVRILDLALGLTDALAAEWFIVGREEREEALRLEFESLVFDRVCDVDVRFLPYRELRKLRAAELLPREGLALIRGSSRSLRRAAGT